ncbi:MAG: hypothetical protein ACQEQD_04585 [Bacillota bacterium]
MSNIKKKNKYQLQKGSLVLYHPDYRDFKSPGIFKARSENYANHS